jgi:hypothetical protein
MSKHLGHMNFTIIPQWDSGCSAAGLLTHSLILGHCAMTQPCAQY